MPTRPTGVTDTTNADTVLEVDVIERPSPDLTTVTTADPGAGGTTLAVSSAARFPASGNYKIRVEAEVMRVTAGQGTTSWTVTRGIDGTTAVAHTSGATVAMVVGVQRVEPVDGSRVVTYRGRVNAFRTPGRAGTAGAKLLALHNATGSAVKLRVTKAWVDFSCTAVKAVTVLPVTIQLCKFTALPTNGTSLTKTPMDSARSSAAAVTAWGDASADGTASATTLTITIPAGMVLDQMFGSRLITAAGFENDTKIEFLEEDDFVTLNALEGLVIHRNYSVATQDVVASDFWVAGMEWEEYTVA